MGRIVRRHRQSKRASRDSLTAEGIDPDRAIALRAVVYQHRIECSSERDGRVD